MADSKSGKVGDLPFTKKQINVAMAAFMATDPRATIDWDLFVHYSGLANYGSATSAISHSKREIAGLLQAGGFDLREGQVTKGKSGGATDDGGGASGSDGVTSTPKRKAGGQVKSTPKKRAKVDKGPKIKKEPKMTREERENAEFDKLMSGDF